MKHVRDITLVLPYYRNPGMLLRQQELWRTYPDDLKARLHVIIVDDGSPKYRADKVFSPVQGIASQRLYRIGVDVRWNWLACRNLGWSEATTEWVLFTDIDHLMPVETLKRIVTGPLDDQQVYRFSRVDAPNLTPYKPHPNTWMMTRDMFDRIGGYDERFSGWYGTDGEFRDRVQATAKAVVMLPDVMIRVPREVIPDASTTHYGRKEQRDRDNVSRIRNERMLIPNWRPLKLTFPWERLA